MLTWMRKKMKLIIATVAVVFAGTMFYGITMSRLGDRGRSEQTYLATINHKPIDQEKFMQTYSRLVSLREKAPSPEEVLKLQYQALKDTIQRTILLEEARRKRIKVTAQDVDIAISQVMEANRITALEDLESSLKRNGLTLQEFKEGLKEEIKIQKLTSLTLADAMLSENDFKEIKLRLIYVKTNLGMKEPQRINRRQKAESLLDQLKRGHDFAAVAGEFSEDPATKNKGGDLGYITTGNLPKELEEAAFALSPEAVSELIETPNGFYILKVEDKRLRTSPDKERDIRTYLLEEKQGKAMNLWQKELDEKYKTEISNKAMRGLKFLDTGKLAEAEAELQAAQTEQPNNPYLLLILAEVYEKVGKQKFALKALQKAAEISPGDSQIHIKAGRAYNKEGNSQKAIEEFKKASILAGDNLELHEKILGFYQEMNAGSEAAAEKKEISRLKKKQAFEEEMRSQAEKLLPEMPLNKNVK